MISLSFLRIWYQWTLLLMLCSSVVFRCFAGELRFCWNGPQRILYQDCPGGFIANHPINASCLYYHKADNVPNMIAMFSGKLCDDKLAKELDADFQEIQESSFQVIQFVDVDAVGGPSPGADAGVDKCNASCLTEWVDPRNLDQAPIFIDKVAHPDDESYQKRYVELTKMILIKIINEDEDEEETSEESNPDENGMDGFDNTQQVVDPPKKTDFLLEDSAILQSHMRSVMKLLAKSMKVLFSKCHPFVEPAFYALVFRTMQEFRRMNTNFPDMHIVPLNRIYAILDKCEKAPNTQFLINGTECEDKFVAQTITLPELKTTINYKIQSNSFRWGRYDPIVEAAWNAVMFVHAHCFNVFSSDLLHYSFFVKTMHEVFTQPIVENHWKNPAPVGKGMTLWEMAFDTSDIQNQLQNLDACVHAAYSGSIYQRRLERPFTPEEFMKDPKYDQPPPVPKGWTKGIEEYWKMYEKRGFHDMTDNVGHCLQSADEYADIERKVKDDTCYKQGAGGGGTTSSVARQDGGKTP